MPREITRTSGEILTDVEEAEFHAIASFVIDVQAAYAVLETILDDVVLELAKPDPDLDRLRLEVKRPAPSTP
jgi:hypothetical protein